MSEYLILVIAVAYLVGLFFLAHQSEKRFSKLSNNGIVYALSLMVYCTAWTFYGSVGYAATDGINFLAIYMGPLMTIPFWWLLLRKMIRLTHTMRISSIADFISIRYGKHAGLGTFVAVACFLGVIPYIALQLKAIDSSIRIIGAEGGFDSSLFIVGLLSVFAILFGARNVDANQRKSGLMSAVAFESIVKLVAFIGVGLFVVYGLFNGFGDLFSQASNQFNIKELIGFSEPKSMTDWFFISLVSAIAFLLLPRQFQVANVEAGANERHVLTAIKAVPMYFLAINLFVIPIGLAGILLLPKAAPDFYVLSLPLFAQQELLAILVFIGGFSAASSMILVSTTALSTMLSNYVFIPLILKTQKEQASHRTDYHDVLLFWRRISIIIIMVLAYSYFKFLTSKESLVSIGIISFIAVAQLAPAFFGGMYWKKANVKAAMWSIVSGIAIWFVFLVWPNILNELSFAYGLPFSGASSIGYAISNTLGMSIVSSTVLCSLLGNTGVYVALSLSGIQNAKEVNQAELFVDIFKFSSRFDSSVAWRGTASFPSIKSLLNQFIGRNRTEAVLDRYARRHGIDWDANPKVDSKVISYAERVLTGIIGPSSARIMVSSVVEEEDLDMNDVVSILNESREAIKLNRELQQKSQQLERATLKLKQANSKLQEYSDLKNEFLYTVTHELRTPITSIRAMAEIVNDNEEMEIEDRSKFISNIISESERMSRLISNVLDLEKFESGHQHLERNKKELTPIIEQEVKLIEPFIGNRNIDLKLEVNSHIADVFIDEDRIRQVLNNLLSNAVKYCDQQNGEIIITAYNQGDLVKVNVSNNGSGIDALELPSIFDKFYQSRNQTRKKPTGHGLGLAICKNIVEMHEGKIAVETVNEMVRFSFTLPCFKPSMQS